MTRARTVLDRIVAAAEADGFGGHGVHVLVGDDEAEHHWSADERRDVWSVAKAVCVLAAGIASDEGVLDVDAPVSTYLPDVVLGAGVEAVTTRHLLAMTSGVDFPWSETALVEWPDPAREFLGRPAPRRAFQYSNLSSYTAMRVLGAVVGDVADWLEPRLFAPLGIDGPPWDRCPQGWVVGGSGLHLRVAELARVGRLIRDDGVWHGRRLVSAAWPRAMHTDWLEHDAPPGYTRTALAGWGGPGDAWRLHGAHGQLVVFRDDAVVTILAHDHAGADRMAERVVESLTT